MRGPTCYCSFAPRPRRQVRGRQPGRPRSSRGRRVSELRQAAEEAVTPDMARGVMRKVTMLALQGNLAAIRIFLERTLGRVTEAPGGEPLDIEPLRLKTAADCSAALQPVADALRDGRLDTTTAKVLTDVIQTQAKLIETGDLEARLAELEKQASVVDFRPRRN